MSEAFNGSRLYSKVIQKMNGKLIGVEENIRYLSTLFSNFVEQKVGGSALMVGPKHSGKASIIKKALYSFVDSVEILWIDGYLYDTDAAAIRFLDQNDVKLDVAHIIIVTNCETFSLNDNQIFLYKILNASRHEPLFALLVSCRQDCVDHLEKRIRSRLSNLRLIVTYKDVTIEKFHCAVHQLLCLNDEYDPFVANYNRSINEFLTNDSVLATLQSIYDECRSYADLKAILTIFLCFVGVSKCRDLSDEKCTTIFREAKISFLPEDDDMQVILSSLTVRQLCLLSCCMKVVGTCRMNEFTYCSVAQCYHRFSKQYLTSLNVYDEDMIYKELDTLSDLGILEKKAFSGQLAFKKTSFQVDPSLIINSLSNAVLPTAIQPWLEKLEDVREY